MRLIFRFALQLAAISALALIAVLVTGCIAGGGYSTRDRVTEAAREYNEGVRWGKYDQAAAHVPADRREHFIEQHQSLEDELEIADYEMVGLEVQKKDERAVTHVEYTWLLKDRGIVEKTDVDQVWTRHGSEWLVSSETRTRGAPLVLFDEPAKKPDAK